MITPKERINETKDASFLQRYLIKQRRNPRKSLLENKLLRN